MSSLGYSAVKTATGITLVVDGKPNSIPTSAINYAAVEAAIRRRAPKEEVVELLSPRQAVEKMVERHGFEIKIDEDGDEIAVFFDGVEVDDFIAKRIMETFRKRESIAPLEAFVRKAVRSHPYTKVNELFRFMNRNELPLHPDGDIIAFKAVLPSGWDKYTGSTVLYELGKYAEVERAKCDTNPQRECSTGLHIGGRNYVQNFRSSRDKVFVVKVDPADFVAVPVADFQKARVCKMFVYSEIFGDVNSAHLTMVVQEADGDARQDSADKTAGVTEKPVKLRDGSVEKERRKKAAEVKKAAKKVEKKIKADAKKGESVDVPEGEDRVFTTKSGVTVKASVLKAAVAAKGQRGAAAELGVPRTSIQDWLKALG